jgi:hypothetical protein
MISPHEFEALLLVAKRHKVMAFELGELKVNFSATAFIEKGAEIVPTEQKPVADPQRKPLQFGQFTEEDMFSG